MAKVQIRTYVEKANDRDEHAQGERLLEAFERDGHERDEVTDDVSDHFGVSLGHFRDFFPAGNQLVGLPEIQECP
jgi:hypothetical protein